MRSYLKILWKYKIALFLIMLLSFYAFQGFFVKSGLSILQFVFIFCVYCCLVLNKKKNNSLKLASLYLVAGVLCLLLSFIVIPDNAHIVAPVGFVVTYFYFFLWFLFYQHYDNQSIEKILRVFYYSIIVFSVFSGLLGIYQIFVDASIGGFAINEIYGDVEKMASGAHQSRATGLFGSAQNYGCFMGLAFCLAIFYRFKNTFIWYICLFIILLGVIVSNSRSASSCVLIGMTLGVFFYNKKYNISNLKLIPFFLILGLIIYFIVQFIMDYDLDKYSRLLNFDNHIAREVYSTTYKSTDFTEFFLGHGLGYRNYTVNQLLGESMYYDSFYEKYTSCESFFMTVWTQGGIILLIPVILFNLKIVYNSLKHNSFPIILCIIVNMLFTPSLTGLSISFICWPILLKELHDEALQGKMKLARNNKSASQKM